MNNRGFTLIETLVALVVLAIGLLALTSMNITYTRANTFSHYLSEATVLAYEKMERLHAYGASEKFAGSSVFDFDYLTSEQTGFTSLEDPPGSGTNVTVHGLLSGGNGGSAVATSGGATYEVLYDDGTNGDVFAGDGVYTGTDTVPTPVGAPGATTFDVTRIFSVEPLDVNADGTYDFAKLEVEAQWTDKLLKEHSVHLESMVYRRQ